MREGPGGMAPERCIPVSNIPVWDYSGGSPNQRADVPRQPQPEPEVSPRRIAQGVVSLVAIGFLVWQLIGPGGLFNAKSAVVDKFIRQYQIADSLGSAMDKCVQAGLVAAALLQANEAERYASWKSIEGNVCAAAGVRR